MADREKKTKSDPLVNIYCPVPRTEKAKLDARCKRLSGLKLNGCYAAALRLFNLLPDRTAVFLTTFGPGQKPYDDVLHKILASLDDDSGQMARQQRA